MAKWGVVLVLIFFPILIVTFFWFLRNTWSNALKAGSSMFDVVRTSLPVIYLLNCLPGAALCELADSQAKKRVFKPLNVLVFLLLLGEYFLMAGGVLSLLEVSLHSVSVSVQFPLLTASLILPLLPTVATFKVRRFQGFLEKSFE